MPKGNRINYEGLVGKEFGNLRVVEYSEEKVGGKRAAICECKCGQRRLVQLYQLINLKVVACGGADCLYSSSKGRPRKLKGEIKRVIKIATKEPVQSPVKESVQEPIQVKEPVKELPLKEVIYPDFEAEDDIVIVGITLGDLKILDQISGLNDAGELQLILETQCKCGRSTYLKQEDVIYGKVTSCLVCSEKAITEKALELAKVELVKEFREKELTGNSKKSLNTVSKIIKKEISEGDQFGELTVISEMCTGIYANTANRVLCRCSCGAVTTASKYDLLRSMRTSCGCKRGRRKKA